MSAPSADRVTELAPAWESVSVHEAGHAVIGVLLGVPVHHVRLDYQRVSLLGRWEVTGWTAIGPGGQGADLHERDAVLFTLAGLEAEALWIAAAHNIPFPRAQADVESRKANRGDLDTIAACLPDAELTLDHAHVWCQNVLIGHWDAVEAVAEALREHRYLPGTAVAKLV